MNIRARNISVRALLGLSTVVALATLPAGADEPPTQAEFVGLWQGTLAVGDARLRLVFDLDQSNDAELEATLDSPDQGASGIPVAAVKVEGDSIRLEIRVINAVFEGRLIEEGKAIEGEWRQSDHVFPLRVERIEEEP